MATIEIETGTFRGSQIRVFRKQIGKKRETKYGQMKNGKRYNETRWLEIGHNIC